MCVSFTRRSWRLCGTGGNPKNSESPRYLPRVGTPRTAFDGSRPVTIEQITDGTENTVLVIEDSKAPVHWMAPQDLPATTTFPAISASDNEKTSNHEGIAHLLFADGAVRAISHQVKRQTVRALLTIDAGDQPGDF